MRCLTGASLLTCVKKDILAGNHDVEQQHILSKYLVSYQARFKVITCPSPEAPTSSPAAI